VYKDPTGHLSISSDLGEQFSSILQDSFPILGIINGLIKCSGNSDKTVLAKDAIKETVEENLKQEKNSKVKAANSKKSDNSYGIKFGSPLENLTNSDQ
jgi:hypothetical protein